MPHISGVKKKNVHVAANCRLSRVYESFGNTTGTESERWSFTAAVMNTSHQWGKNVIVLYNTLSRKAFKSKVGG